VAWRGFGAYNGTFGGWIYIEVWFVGTLALSGTCVAE
jgi:hypothetical protein